MFGWVESSLYEAIEHLARSGKNHLASDLGRLLETLDLDEIDVFRNAEAEAIADALIEVSTFPDLVDLMRQFCQAIGVADCTLHVVSEVPSSAFTTRVLTTYNEEWVTRYINRRYFMVDPVNRASVTAEAGFFWDTLDASVPSVRDFCRDAMAHGVGTSGYTLPIITERGDKISLSVNSREPRAAFRERVHQLEADLFSVGFCFAEAFSRLASESRPSKFTPTDDQMAILRAVAIGASEADLRAESYLYGSYSTLERSICNLFRTKTVAQAAIVAARVGLLTNSPLTKSDIMIGSSKVPTNRVLTTPNSASVRRLIRMRNVMPADKDGAAPEVPSAARRKAAAANFAERQRIWTRREE